MARRSVDDLKSLHNYMKAQLAGEMGEELGRGKRG